MPEKNEGYEIVAREVYSTSRLGQQDSIVLGRNETKYGTMFVTWDCTGWPLKNGGMKFDYYWGHYYDEEAKARADYHRRLIEKYERGATQSER